MDAGLPRVEFETLGRIASAVGKTRANRAPSDKNQPISAFQPQFHQPGRLKTDRLLGRLGMPTRGDRHLLAMQHAKQLAALGARLKTIHVMTGMPPRQVQSLFFPDAHTIPRGRAPDSAEWY